MSKRNPRSYDKEFKLNAVKLYLESGRSYRQIGDELGIPEATLAGWVGDYKKDGQNSFPGKGHQKPEDEELAQLRKELAIAREERDILKKALGIFSSIRK
jgi:transposase-like protein